MVLSATAASTGSLTVATVRRGQALTASRTRLATISFPVFVLPR